MGEGYYLSVSREELFRRCYSYQRILRDVREA